MTQRSGRIKYEERAFEQDAGLAMGGDIMRALVELITNADDAYGELDGDIVINVNSSKSGENFVSVSDNAIGLDADGLERSFSVLGGKVSGFAEGKNVRGLLGRGAKDTAVFGRTTFESIKNDSFAAFTLTRQGDWTATGDRQVLASEYRSLAIPVGTNGLRATIHVEIASKIPSQRVLFDRLVNNCQLRDISAARRILLKYVQNEKPQPSSAIRWSTPPGQQIVTSTLQIPGYPDATATLQLHKLDQLESGSVTQESRHGIEVAGSKAVFANENFGETSIEFGWLHGRLTCTYIDRLIRAFDEEKVHSEDNPDRLLRRDRDGLEKNHPFYKALRSSVLDVIQPILAELQPKRDKVSGSEELKNDLNKAAKQLASLLKSDLARLDEEEPRGGSQPTIAHPILLIPPILRIPHTKKRSISCLIRSDLLENGAIVAAVTSNESVISIVSQPTIFRPHSRFESVSVGTIQLEGLALGEATLTVIAGDTSASSEIFVVDQPQIEDDPPTELTWNSKSISATLNKPRTILLRAPLEMASNSALTANIVSESLDVELIDSLVDLEVNEHGWLEARIGIVGRKLDSKVKITASAGGQNTTTTIKITLPSSGGDWNLHIDLHDSSGNTYRGELKQSEDGFRITIFAKHPSLARLLGQKLESGRWEHEHMPASRTGLAEAVTSVLVDWLLKEDAVRNPESFTDAVGVLSDRNKLVFRYLPVAIAALATGENPVEQ
jgi:hypothetical protein